mgnify:CR=1 FL=1
MGNRWRRDRSGPPPQLTQDQPHHQVERDDVPAVERNVQPSESDGRRGDIIIEVRLMMPRLLDERSKELLREFGRINGENVREIL